MTTSNSPAPPPPRSWTEEILFNRKTPLIRHPSPTLNRTQLITTMAIWIFRRVLVSVLFIFTYESFQTTKYCSGSSDWLGRGVRTTGNKIVVPSLYLYFSIGRPLTLSRLCRQCHAWPGREWEIIVRCEMCFLEAHKNKRGQGFIWKYFFFFNWKKC